MRMKHFFVSAFIVLVLLAVVGTAYRSFVPGLSSARSEPPGIEVSLATWLLHHSVPDAEAARTNPLGSDPADVAAGSDLFKKKCEICHAYDGSGKQKSDRGNTRVLRRYARSMSLRCRTARFSITSETAFVIPECRLGRCRSGTFGNS
jgi:hypothetical protein